MIYKTAVWRLQVCVYETREEMGRAAAEIGVERIRRVLEKKKEANVVFAAAPSQFELYEALIASDLDFSRINAFHMDEYLHISPDAPQGFGNLLRTRLFSKCPFHTVNYIRSDAPDERAECERMTALLRAYPPDFVFHGIGENGHLAFNDPPNADFSDSQSVKIVAMDDVCRMQQVHDGCFKTLDDVPLRAYTMTIPQLTDAAPHTVVTVPGKTKTEAVRRMLQDDISTACPASILRRHRDSTLVLDRDAARAILPKGV